MKQVPDYNCAKLAYFANFHNVAIYGIVLCGSTFGMEKLFMVQKDIRPLCELGNRDRCRAVFKKEAILTLSGVYILACVRYIHQNKQLFMKNGGSTHL